MAYYVCSSYNHTVDDVTVISMKGFLKFSEFSGGSPLTLFSTFTHAVVSEIIGAFGHAIVTVGVAT